MDKILILDEDEAASGFLAMALQREHFFPILANSREAALQSICTLQPDMLVINTPLAGVDSVALCMQMQKCHTNKPIIILGDGNDEMEKVLALEAGADDYLVQPVASRELVARVRALLRRRRANRDPLIRFGVVEVDRQRRTVISRGREIKMTPCEYKLLVFFLGNADLALTRETLLSSVWGYSPDMSTRTLDAHVSKLRNKCEPDPSTPKHFVTVHGVGYRFVM